MQINGAEDANNSANKMAQDANNDVNKMAQDANNDVNKLKDLALFMLDLLVF